VVIVSPWKAEASTLYNSIQIH